MNKVILLGRLVEKPELRYSKENVAVLSFTIAVQRNFKNESGDYEADFINCSAFRKTAELISEYFNKGSKILVIGSLRHDNYQNKDGENRYITRVAVESFDFIDTTKKAETTAPAEEKFENDPFAEYGEQITIEEANLLPDDFLD